MIRVVLAAALATALFGVSLPVAEDVERDRNAAIASEELSTVARTADRLADDNDPATAGRAPAGITIVVDPPDATLTDGGRLVIEDDRLAWVPHIGPNRTTTSEIPIRVEGPLVITGRTPLRLSFVSTGGTVAVRVRRARVEKRNRGQSAHVRGTPVDRLGLSV